MIYRKTEEFVAGKGVVTKWERVRRANHWFDALYNACAAGHLCGVRLIGERPVKKERISLGELQRQRRQGDKPMQTRPASSTSGC